MNVQFMQRVTPQKPQIAFKGLTQQERYNIVERATEKQTQVGNLNVEISNLIDNVASDILEQKIHNKELDFSSDNKWGTMKDSKRAEIGQKVVIQAIRYLMGWGETPIDIDPVPDAKQKAFDLLA